MPNWLKALACLALLAPSVFAQAPARKPMPVFLDTDIGSDVDDSLALATLLENPEYRLVGISTVNGDVVTRAKIALRELELAGHSEIPVAAGVGSTLLRRKVPRDWSRELRQHLDREPQIKASSIHGVDLLIKSVHENPGLRVLAVGPLTNVALAIIKEPSIAREIGELVVVGGATSVPAFSEKGTIYIDYKSEYNLNCDPDAAQLVFESPVPILMSGLAPALQVTVNRKDLEVWGKIRTPIASWIIQRVSERLNTHHASETHLGDVLGVVMARHSELADVPTLPIHAEMWGDTLRTVIDPTGSGRSVRVVTNVDVKRFHDYFTASIARCLARMPERPSVAAPPEPTPAPAPTPGNVEAPY